MADTELAVRIDSAASLVEQLGKACLELEACKYHAEDMVLWTEIKEHFSNLETTLKRQAEELEAKEKEFELKDIESRAMLAMREADVAAKEQDLLDRVHELKATAIANIVEAREKHCPSSSTESEDDEYNIANKVSSVVEDQSPSKTGEKAEGIATEVKPRPELMQFCEQMDANGLVNFIMENLKSISVVRDELSIALVSATEPARLVLDSLEGFYPHDESAQPPVDTSDAAFQGMRQSCIIIIQAMATMLSRAVPGVDHLLSPEIKEQAKAIAFEWKPKLATNIDLLEAEGFLQLIGTFSIASEFDEEDICKLVLAVAGNRHLPALCRSLGLTRKIPGIVELLINTGKQVEAVHLVQAFKLTESYSSATLLKTYLRDLRRNGQIRGGAGEAMQAELNAKEFAAVKAVIKCIKQYNLEADYPLDPLQRREVQLEPRSDKKRTGDFPRHPQHPKKTRPNRGGFSGSRARGPAPPFYGDRPGAPPFYGDRPGATYMGMSERYPPVSAPVAPSVYNYQVPNQAAYPQYAVDQRAYPMAYNPPPTAAASSYAGYVGVGLQPTNQPYM